MLRFAVHVSLAGFLLAAPATLAQQQPGAGAGGVHIGVDRGVHIPRIPRYEKQKLGNPCPPTNPAFVVDPRTVLNEATIRHFAHNGVVTYQARLGRELLGGQLADRDPQEAAFWIRCAADNGDAPSMVLAAQQIEQRDGVTDPPELAFRYALGAATAGDPTGFHLVGNYCFNGYGTAKDPAKGLEWYTRGAEGGNVTLQAAVGLRYFTGDGIAKDLKVAEGWLRRAAENGSAEAAHNLALLCEQKKDCKPVPALGPGDGKTMSLEEAIAVARDELWRIETLSELCTGKDPENARYHEVAAFFWRVENRDALWVALTAEGSSKSRTPEPARVSLELSSDACVTQSRSVFAGEQGLGRRAPEAERVLLAYLAGHPIPEPEWAERETALGCINRALNENMDYHVAVRRCECTGRAFVDATTPAERQAFWKSLEEGKEESQWEWLSKKLPELLKRCGSEWK